MEENEWLWKLEEKGVLERGSKGGNQDANSMSLEEKLSEACVAGMRYATIAVICKSQWKVGIS